MHPWNEYYLTAPRRLRILAPHSFGIKRLSCCQQGFYTVYESTCAALVHLLSLLVSLAGAAGMAPVAPAIVDNQQAMNRRTSCPTLRAPT